MNAMAVAAVHRIGARGERLTLAAAVRRIARRFAVHHVRGDGEDALGMRCVAIGRMLADLLLVRRHVRLAEQLSGHQQVQQLQPLVQQGGGGQGDALKAKLALALVVAARER